MLIIFLLKTICQLSLYLAFARIVSDIFQLQLANFGTLFLFLVALLGSYGLSKRPLGVRLLPLLLAGILVPYAGTGDWIFIILPLTAFSAHIAFTRGYTINLGSFKNILGIGLAYLAVMGFASAITEGTGAEFLLVALVSGIILSRDLRHDAETIKDPIYMAMNFGLMIIMAGIALFSVSGMMRRFATFIVGGVIDLYNMIMGREDVRHRNQFRVEMPFITPENGYGDFYYYHMYGDPGEHEHPTWLMLSTAVPVIVLLLLLAAVVMFAIWASRKLFLAHGKQPSGQDIIRERLEGGGQKKKTAPEKISGYNGAVRKYYRRFIRLIARGGKILFPSYTSQDLEGISLETLGDPGQDLREVYIRARYSADTITEEDTVLAKDAYRRLKSGRR